MKIVSLLLALVVLSGCGSVRTLSNTEATVSSNLREIETYCGVVPRIYSGVVYDYCSIFSGQTARWSLIWWVPVGFYAVDMIGSVVVDTVALPYSIPAQANKGSFQID